MVEEKIKSLQGLRAYAFILIFISHCSIPFISNHLGPMGVSFFLVLSGYLYMMKLNTGHYYINDFQRVIIKIKKFFPLHLFTLICAIPLSSQIFERKNLCILLLNATCIHAWIPIQKVFFSLNFVSWYLCVAIFMILISRLVNKMFLKFDGILKIILFQILLVIAEFALAYFIHDALAHWFLYIFPLTRMLDFILGGAFFLRKKVRNYQILIDYVGK